MSQRATEAAKAAAEAERTLTALKDEACDLRARGWSLRDMARHFGVSKSKIQRLVADIKPTPAATAERAAQKGLSPPPPRPDQTPEPEPVLPATPMRRLLAGGLLSPEALRAMWLRKKAELQHHPAVSDGEYLPARMAMLIHRLLDNIEARLSEARHLHELAGLLKIVVEMRQLLTDSPTAITETRTDATATPTEAEDTTELDRRLAAVKERAAKVGLTVVETPPEPAAGAA